MTFSRDLYEKELEKKRQMMLAGEMMPDQSEYPEMDEDHGLEPGMFEEDDELSPRQSAIEEMTKMIVDKFGKFDSTSYSEGAHYAPAEKNPFKADGLICANCVYYEGGGECDVVNGPEENGGRVDPNAVCKLWIIDNGLIGGAETESAVEYGAEAGIEE